MYDRRNTRPDQRLNQSEISAGIDGIDRVSIGIEIFVQALGILNRSVIRIKPIKPPDIRVVISRPQILHPNLRIELLAAVKQVGQQRRGGRQ